MMWITVVLNVPIVPYRAYITHILTVGSVATYLVQKKLCYFFRLCTYIFIVFVLEFHLDSRELPSRRTHMPCN